MPRLSIESRKRIVSLHSCGFSVPSIVQRLKQEKVAVSQRAVYNLVKKFGVSIPCVVMQRTRGTITRVTFVE